jgi:hypothetical protein
MMKCLIGLPLLIHIELLWRSQSRSQSLKNRGVRVRGFVYRLHSSASEVFMVVNNMITFIWDVTLCSVGHDYQCYREMYCLHIQDRHNTNHPANYMASHFRKPHILIVYFLQVQPQTVNLQIWMDDYNQASFATFQWGSPTNFYMILLSPPCVLCQAHHTLPCFTQQYHVTCACHKVPNYVNFLNYMPVSPCSFLNPEHSVYKDFYECMTLTFPNIQNRVVESVHKTSNSDSSIFKTPTTTPTPS